MRGKVFPATQFQAARDQWNSDNAIQEPKRTGKIKRIAWFALETETAREQLVTKINTHATVTSALI